MYDAWSITLRSPSMSLKEHGFRTLSDILEGVCALWQRRAVADGATIYSPEWSKYLRLVPAERVEAMAMRRLDKEREDAPRYSRYLQVCWDRGCVVACDASPVLSSPVLYSSVSALSCPPSLLTALR
jgi:hypothetical protein